MSNRVLAWLVVFLLSGVFYLLPSVSFDEVLWYATGAAIADVLTWLANRMEG